MNDQIPTHLCKVIIVGEQSIELIKQNLDIGKSSLLRQYTKQQFSKQYNVTIGVEYTSKTVQLDETYPNLTLQIWDTAGQESFKSIVRSFYRRAGVVLIVYNITKKETFKAVDAWLDEIREYAHKDIITALVGNQVDRQELREVQYEEGLQYMKDKSLDMFIETSAKTSFNVNCAFQQIAQIVYDKFIKTQYQQITNSTEADGEENKLSGERLLIKNIQGDYKGSDSDMFESSMKQNNRQSCNSDKSNKLNEKKKCC